MAKDKDGLEGTGFRIHHPVKASDGETEVTGIVEAVHAGGKKIDVRVNQPGSKNHGRVMTFPADEVDEASEPKAKEKTA